MHPALMPTAKLTRHSSVGHIRDVIWETQELLMKEYDSGGKIGKKTPKDWNDASSMALNLSYEDARRHAGAKVPKLETLEQPKG